MAAPGRKPKPTALRLVEGNREHRPINKAEPKPQPVMPVCPDFIEGKARDVWDRYGPMLVRLGVLTEADGLAFAALCNEWARYVELVENKEMVQTFESGARQVAPEVSASHKCLTQLLRLFGEFGLTPSSRARLSIKEDKEDAFGDLIGVR
jgi:P27 family predicted phage terminase small subunit